MLKNINVIHVKFQSSIVDLSLVLKIKNMMYMYFVKNVVNI